jgi:WD40 repeat protein
VLEGGGLDAEDPVRAIQFVDGGRRLALAYEAEASWARVVLIEAAEGAMPTELRPPDRPGGDCADPNAVNALGFEPVTNLLVSGWSNGRVVVWDLSKTAALPTINFVSETCTPVTSVQLTSEGRLFATSEDRTILSWNTRTPSSRPTRLTIPEGSGGRDMLTAAAFSGDGRHAIAVLHRESYREGDSEVRLVDVTTGDTRRTLAQGAGLFRSPRFTPDGRRVLAAGPDGTVRIWNAESGEEQRTLRGHTGATSLALPPSNADGAKRGDELVAGDSEGTLRLWSVTALPGRELIGHKGDATSVAFGPDGTWLVSGGADGTVRLWDVATGKETRQLGQHGSHVYTVAVSPDGRRIASAGGTAMDLGFTSKPGNDKAIRIWGPESQGPPLLTIEPPSDVIALAFSPDGRILATAGAGDAIHLWDAASGKEVRQIQLMKTGALALALNFSRDGRLIAAATSGAQVFDVASGQEIASTLRSVASKRSEDEGQTSAAVFGDNDRILLTTSVNDANIQTWEPTTGQLMGEFKGYGPNNAADLSRDGTLAVTGDLPGNASIWDVRTGTLMASLPGTEGAWGVAFSANATRIATTGSSDSVFVWDCAVCGPLPEVLRLVRERLTGALSEEQTRTVESR